MKLRFKFLIVMFLCIGIYIAAWIHPFPLVIKISSLLLAGVFAGMYMREAYKP